MAVWRIACVCAGRSTGYSISFFWIVHTLPDKLLRWIGGGHEQLGEAAAGLSKTGAAGAESAGLHVSDAASKTMQSMTAQATMAARPATASRVKCKRRRRRLTSDEPARRWLRAAAPSLTER